MGQIFARIARRSLIPEIIRVDLRIIPNDLKHLATNINDDFVNFGEVEQGPEAQNPFPEEYFQIPTFWRQLFVVIWLFPAI